MAGAGIDGAPAPKAPAPEIAQAAPAPSAPPVAVRGVAKFKVTSPPPPKLPLRAPPTPGRRAGRPPGRPPTKLNSVRRGLPDPEIPPGMRPMPKAFPVRAPPPPEEPVQRAPMVNVALPAPKASTALPAPKAPSVSAVVDGLAAGGKAVGAEVAEDKEPSAVAKVAGDVDAELLKPLQQAIQKGRKIVTILRYNQLGGSHASVVKGIFDSFGGIRQLQGMEIDQLELVHQALITATGAGAFEESVATAGVPMYLQTLENVANMAGVDLRGLREADTTALTEVVRLAALAQDASPASLPVQLMLATAAVVMPVYEANRKKNSEQKRDVTFSSVVECSSDSSSSDSSDDDSDGESAEEDDETTTDSSSSSDSERDAAAAVSSGKSEVA